MWLWFCNGIQIKMREYKGNQICKAGHNVQDKNCSMVLYPGVLWLDAMMAIVHFISLFVVPSSLWALLIRMCMQWYMHLVFLTVLVVDVLFFKGFVLYILIFRFYLKRTSYIFFYFIFSFVNIFKLHLMRIERFHISCVFILLLWFNKI